MKAHIVNANSIKSIRTEVGFNLHSYNVAFGKPKAGIVKGLLPIQPQYACDLSYSTKITLNTGELISIVDYQGEVFRYQLNYGNVSWISPERGEITAGENVSIFSETNSGTTLAHTKVHYSVNNGEWLTQAMNPSPHEKNKVKTIWTSKIGGFKDKDIIEYRIEYIDKKGKSSSDEGIYKTNYWFKIGREDFPKVNVGKNEEPIALSNLEIEKSMSEGEVVNYGIFASETITTHELFKVDLTYKGSSFSCLFKQGLKGVSKEELQSGQSAGMEYVAYRLNLILGQNMVPPVVFREFEWKGEKLSGYLLYMVNEVVNELNIDYSAPETWFSGSPAASDIDIELFFSDVLIFDSLIYNYDRTHHIGSPNFILGKHWVNGKRRPLLIDHAAAMTDKAQFILRTNSRFDRFYFPMHVFDQSNWKKSTVNRVRASTLVNLERLNKKVLENLINEGWLSEKMVMNILKKKRSILNYFHSGITVDGLKIEVIDSPILY
jgi:hypothetical protein